MGSGLGRSPAPCTKRLTADQVLSGFGRYAARDGGLYLSFNGIDMSDVQDFIRETVTNNSVVLFMKGTAQAPQCGFSARAVQILRAVGVSKLVTVNVLDDDEVRQGIKDYANWPTIPQLYIGGEFIGGSDIMSEMFESDELTTVLKDAGAIE